jgi:haloalkane dehalogenase
MTTQKPADFPYPSHFADVLGSRMHYVEHGSGDPILFLHGQPTWSYLWRNVLPELEGKGRLIAVDLIGYGMSDEPDIPYDIDDHIGYLDGFIEALGLDRITIVCHDWGSFFGFHYAHRHPERIKGLAFLEAMLNPIPGYDAFDPQTRAFFQTLRSSQANAERMMMDENQFVENILPAMICRPLERQELDAYRAPWTDRQSRRILCTFPQNLCIGKEPASVYRMQTAYIEWLGQTDLPKLLIHAEPGFLIPAPAVDQYRQQLPNLETAFVGSGLHYIQEDQPQKIGQAIAQWMDRCGL